MMVTGFILFLFPMIFGVEANRTRSCGNNLLDENYGLGECSNVDCQEPQHFGRYRRGAEFRPYSTGKELAKSISSTLHVLLGPRYNRQVRPEFGVKPVKVELNLSVLGIGPVDEMTQSYTLDCYFRQSWVDERLSFSTKGLTELSLDWRILSLIWTPDTFFLNGKKSRMHKVTVPNRFARIKPDGRVSFSQRLTIKATCPMGLKKYPFDSQVCPLIVGSYGYPSEDMLYYWKEPKPMNIADDPPMAQFKLKTWEANTTVTSHTNRKIESGYRTDSIAYIRFYFERQSGFFMLQHFFPLFLIVACSWVAFFIVKTDVPARCGLGVTTVLSITKLGFGGSKPQVPYATALDAFVIISFFTAFASLIEFAVINFITVYINRFKAGEERQREEEKARIEMLKAGELRRLLEAEAARKKKKESREHKAANGMVVIAQADALRGAAVPMADEEGDTTSTESRSTSTGGRGRNSPGEEDIVVESRDSFTWSGSEELNKWAAARRIFVRYWDKAAEALITATTRIISFFTVRPVTQMLIYRDTEEALELIDSYSRVGFPGVFGFVMLIYWPLYLYILEDESPLDNSKIFGEPANAS